MREVQHAEPQLVLPQRHETPRALVPRVTENAIWGKLIHQVTSIVVIDDAADGTLTEAVGRRDLRAATAAYVAAHHMYESQHEAIMSD